MFGQALAANSGDPGHRQHSTVSQYCVASWVSTRMGEEVLMEGAAPLGGKLFIVPSLKVIREGHSLPLILNKQALHAGKCGKDSL